MHARQRILTNGSFKDGIEIDTKWVVTAAFMQRVLEKTLVILSFRSDMSNWRPAALLLV